MAPETDSQRQPQWIDNHGWAESIHAMRAGKLKGASMPAAALVAYDAAPEQKKRSYLVEDVPETASVLWARQVELTPLEIEIAKIGSAVRREFIGRQQQSHAILVKLSLTTEEKLFVDHLLQYKGYSTNWSDPVSDINPEDVDASLTPLGYELELRMAEAPYAVQ